MGEKANLYIQRNITHKKIMCKDQKCFENLLYRILC